MRLLDPGLTVRFPVDRMLVSAIWLIHNDHDRRKLLVHCGASGEDKTLSCRLLAGVQEM